MVSLRQYFITSLNSEMMYFESNLTSVHFLAGVHRAEGEEKVFLDPLRVPAWV